MINEVALVLLFGLFGWKVAALYLGTGLVIAMVAGWVIGRLRLERWVEAGSTRLPLRHRGPRRKQRLTLERAPGRLAATR